MQNNPREILLELTASYPILQSVSGAIEASFICLRDSLSIGGCLYTCGNGGSAADAEHIAGELLKGFRQKRPLPSEEQCRLEKFGEPGVYLASRLQQGLRCVALTGHPSLATAMANDVAAELVFAQQLNALGKAGDVLLGISTSGNARNVALAATVAKLKDMRVIALTGEDGGVLASMGDVAIKVPGTATHKIQELHLPVYHALCAMLEAVFFPL